MHKVKNQPRHRMNHGKFDITQLVLPECYHGKVLKSLHDDMGHQGIERTLALLHERFYWPTMSQDASDYVT